MLYFVESFPSPIWRVAERAKSQEKASAEERLFKQGRSSIDMLIEAQDNVLYSKSHYAQIAAEYQKFTITYLALIDELMSNYKVALWSAFLIFL